MKKISSLILFSSLCIWSYGQNTNFGTNAGNAGSFNSAFGYYSLDNTVGSYNTASGAYALLGNVQGDKNTAVGYRALYRNYDGTLNTSVGTSSMLTNIDGSYNTAIGSWALLSNIDGSFNTALGMSALYSNTTGANNTAAGFQSMSKNTTGSNNTAYGYQSLRYNESAANNTAIGYQALYYNSQGTGNSAVGRWAMHKNTVGRNNAAMGGEALASNIDGEDNVAMGYKALSMNTSGYGNVSVGVFALSGNTTGEENTALGNQSLLGNSTGFGNTALGAVAGLTGGPHNNATAVGYAAYVTASNAVRIGNTGVTSIGGQADWTNFSDGRFKEEVKEDAPGLEFITQLRPVSYVVNKSKLNAFLGVEPSEKEAAFTAEERRESGFIAQEVEEIVKESGYTFSGVDEAQNENDIYGIRYAAFVVPLVKAVQELNSKVEAQDATIEELKDIIEAQQRAMETGQDEAPLSTPNVGSETSVFSIYPNPTSGEATIKLTLSEDVSEAKVIIQTLDGKEVSSMPVNGRGNTSVQWSGSNLRAGTYLYSLIADGTVIGTKRMVLTH